MLLAFTLDLPISLLLIYITGVVFWGGFIIGIITHPYERKLWKEQNSRNVTMLGAVLILCGISFVWPISIPWMWKDGLLS